MDIDVTILIQGGIIVILLLSLNGVLFQPMLEVFDARHAKLEGVRENIDELLSLAKADLGTYQRQIREANNRALTTLEALRDEGRARERELLNNVRHEIAESLNQARVSIADNQDQARQQLVQQVDTIAADMATRVLGREVKA